MRILLSAGNPVGHPTGYGMQSVLLVRALAQRGHSVVLIAWNLMLTAMGCSPQSPKFVSMDFEHYLSLVGPDVRNRLSESDKALFQKSLTIMGNPIGVFPHPISKAVLNGAVAATSADFFLAFQDIFVFEKGPFVCPAMVWMPFHFMPMEFKTIQSLNDFDWITAMSMYGHGFADKILGKSAFEKRTPTLTTTPVPLTPKSNHGRKLSFAAHGRPIDIFSPSSSSPTERKDMRALFGWPENAFVVLIVAANTEASNRKAFDAQCEAFVRFAKSLTDAEIAKRPPHLHIHTMLTGEMDIGRIMEYLGEFDDRWLISDTGVAPAESVYFHTDARVVDQNRTVVLDKERGVRGPRFSVTPPSMYGSLQEPKLAALYRSADVLLAASCSEGCGVPIIEAQLCGTPVITNRTTAMSEETLFGISCIPNGIIWRNDFNSGWEQPSVHNLEAALRKMYKTWDADKRARMLLDVMPTLVKRYSDTAIVMQWNKIIQQVEEELDLGTGVFKDDSDIAAMVHATGKRLRSLLAKKQSVAIKLNEVNAKLANYKAELEQCESLLRAVQIARAA